MASGSSGAMLADGESADALAAWTLAEEMPFPLGSYFVADDGSQSEAYKVSEVYFGGLSLEHEIVGSWSRASGTECELCWGNSSFGGARKAEHEVFVSTVEDVWNPSMLALDKERSSGALLGILDTGCTRTIVGQETLKVLRSHIRKSGLRVQTKSETCKFRFGADYSYTSHEKVLLPCVLQRVPCTLSAFVVPGSTPLLISLGVLEALKANINLNKRELDMPVLGISVPLKISAGHLGVDLWQEGSLQPFLFQE
eukprot:3752389-Amphidinium_carterae.1